MTTEEQAKQDEGNSANNSETTSAATEKTSKHGPRTCENPTCGKQFIPLNSRAKYCSPSCNAKASQIRRGLGTTPGTAAPMAAQATAQQPVYTPQQNYGMAGLYGIPPHADVMIKHFEKEAQRWEKKYDTEVADHKVTKQKLEDAKEELRDNEKPGGLNGFLESSSGAEIVKAFAPVLAGFMSSRMPQQQQIAGTAGNEMTKLFGEWTAGLKEESQQLLWATIQKLSNMDEEQMNYTLKGLLQAWQR